MERKAPGHGARCALEEGLQRSAPCRVRAAAASETPGRSSASRRVRPTAAPASAPAPGAPGSDSSQRQRSRPLAGFCLPPMAFKRIYWLEGKGDKWRPRKSVLILNVLKTADCAKLPSGLELRRQAGLGTGTNPTLCCLLKVALA